MARLTVPNTARLPSSIRVDASTSAVVKSLNRLTRESLISLALDWLDESAFPNSTPFLRSRMSEEEDEEDDDEDSEDIYPPARTIEDLRQLYEDMRQQKGSKRDVVSRILEGDWRHGLTLYQLAMADFAYLDEHPTSQKWNAYQILPLQKPSHTEDEQLLKVDKESLQAPRFHPSTFLQNLQDQVLPDVKAHYHFHRLQEFPLLLLRIFVIDSPYNSALALSSLDQSGTVTNFDASRTIYLAFPDGSPSLYTTKSQGTGSAGTGESKSLQNLIIDGVPKALSRPMERYTVKSTSITTRNLAALLDMKGPGRGNAAGGGWSIYADEKNKQSPLDAILPTPPGSREQSASTSGRKRGAPLTQSQRDRKRAKAAAQSRFGDSASISDGKGIERFEVVLQDPFPATSRNRTALEANQEEVSEDGEAQSRPNHRRSKVESVLQQAVQDIDDVDDMNEMDTSPSNWTPMLKVTFSGPHVFAGIRQLVEAGIVDGKRMPGWMTGEETVTKGAVHRGRIRGQKGSGI
ncbi:hypothetical protein V2G26_016097 [Clonostachys chloroleuca]|uniref:Kinetochore protein mis15 n=1 Tax=Clonostachys chloroleuca TaxID=1926264 RepID=A0AA35Q7G1_9HYPO|nr:unnamed protein product [Clonostachys chloroleuca]